MKWVNALDIKPDKKELISIVGGGGKTTLMFCLAKELKQLGKRVLVTTSTRIFYPNKEDYDTLILLNDKDHNSDKRNIYDRHDTYDTNKVTDRNIVQRLDVQSIASPSITIIGNSVSEDGKLLGLDKEMIHKIYRSNLFDVVIVEADGSMRKPIKAPAAHEPVVPEETTKMIGVIGLDALECSIDEENVHRATIFAEVTESQLGEIIDEKIIAKLIIDKNGLFKESPFHSEKVLVLNKADDDIRKMKAVSICNTLKNNAHTIDGMFICSFKNQYSMEVK